MDADRTSMMGQTTSGAAATALGAETCPNCETSIIAGDEFCLKCGYQRGTWKGSNGAAASDVETPPGAQTGAVAQAAPTGPGLWTLIIAGAEYPLAAGTHVLGRGEVDVKLDDGFASRRHAQLEVSVNKLVLTDLGSSNGTFVGDERLEANSPHELADGDSFKIANTEVRVGQVISAEDATQVAPAAEVNEAEPEAGNSPMNASLEPQDAKFDDDGTAIDPGSQIEPGKEGHSPAPHSEAHWELQRDDGESIPLSLGETKLGRKADKADVALEDTYVSGLHCRILVSDANIEVTDLGSTNGTFVNEARLEAEQPWPLADGDKLRLGQTEFKVSDKRPVTEGQEQTEAEGD